MPSWEQPRHGPLRDLDAKFAQFAMDARRSPQRIRGGHLVHQGANGRIRTRAAGAPPFRALRPAATEPIAVSPQHRLRLHDDEGGAPFPPGFAEKDPKEPIGWAEPWAFAATCQCGQLLTKRKVLKGDRLVSAARQDDRPKE